MSSLVRNNRTAWNKKTVFFVHGIGKQPVNFSEPLLAILAAQDPALSDATRWREIAYDSVNDAMEAKVIQFQSALKDNAAGVTSDFLVDLVDYLFGVDPYYWINTITKEAFVEAVQSALDDGVAETDHEIYVLAHSLGTVVSYEALHAIVDDPQTLGVSSGFKLKAYLTLGSPLAFIKANQNRIPSLNKTAFLRSGPISRPARVDTFTSEAVSNIVDWFNFRQRFDPVASLVPLDNSTAPGVLSTDTFVFDAFHSGANPHAFDNYLKEYAASIMSTIKGAPAAGAGRPNA